MMLATGSSSMLVAQLSHKSPSLAFCGSPLAVLLEACHSAAQVCIGRGLQSLQHTTQGTTLSCVLCGRKFGVMCLCWGHTCGVCRMRQQLSEEALLQLAELGYGHKAASRALRFTGGNVAAAVDFLTAQQEKAQVCVLWGFGARGQFWCVFVVLAAPLVHVRRSLSSLLPPVEAACLAQLYMLAKQLSFNGCVLCRHHTGSLRA